MPSASSLPLLLLALPTAVQAWSFSIGAAPMECALLSISFTGNFTYPLTFTILGLPGINSNFTSWGSGFINIAGVDVERSSGSASFPDKFGFGYAWPAGSLVVIVGSDATGFGTGGTSDVYTVQANTNPGSNTTFPNCTAIPAGRPYYLDHVSPWANPPQQCQVVLGVYYNITPPVQTQVIIPGGESFNVTAPSNTTHYLNSGGSYTTGATQFWNLDVPKGTNIAYLVSDAEGPLFISGLQTVQSGDDTCFIAQTPYTSTAVPAAGAVNTSPPSGSGSGSSVNKGAIAGGVVGGVVGLLVLVALGIFITRRHKRYRQIQEPENIGLQIGPTR